MLKLHAFLFFVLTLLSCGKPKEAHFTQQQQQQQQQSHHDSPIAFNVDAHLLGFSDAQKQKLLTAVELIKKVIMSEDFKKRVLVHKYNGNETFLDNMGLTNEEIYNKVMEASEVLNPGINRTMNVDIELYFEEANTIGHTYPNVNRIWMNKKYFDKFSPHQIADNLFHEWVHKLGFDHEVVYSPHRKYSVPYALGYLVKELALKHYP